MLSKGKGANVIGQLLLLSATVVWGSSFIILKETIRDLPAFYVIGVRFLASALLFGAVFFKKIKNIDKETFIHGAVLGLVLSGAYITQTKGLEFISAGKNAFITSLYCVMCPFIAWIAFGAKPKGYNLISAALCVAGIGLIALSGSETDADSFSGSTLTFVCAIFYGLQIVFTGRFHEKKNDIIQLLAIQLLTVGVIVSACSLAFELPYCGIEAYKVNVDQLLRIIYLTLACTLYAQLAQIVGIKFTETNVAAIILTFEAVFGVIFAVVLGDERVTPVLLLGFAVIFIGTLISELKIDVLRVFVKKRRTETDADQDGEDAE